MKLRFLIFETKSPPWVEAARQEYASKLSTFFPFRVQALKSPSADRDNVHSKIKAEAEILFKHLDEKDLLILFDEKGKCFLSSEDFAKAMSRHLESGKAQMTLVIGGPYGYDARVVERSQARWSLSALTFNHWVAQIAALEQLFRAMAIINRLPYHNR